MNGASEAVEETSGGRKCRCSFSRCADSVDLGFVRQGSTVRDQTRSRFTTCHSMKRSSTRPALGVSRTRREMHSTSEKGRPFVRPESGVYFRERAPRRRVPHSSGYTTGPRRVSVSRSRRRETPSPSFESRVTRSADWGSGRRSEASRSCCRFLFSRCCCRRRCFSSSRDPVLLPVVVITRDCDPRRRQ